MIIDIHTHISFNGLAPFFKAMKRYRFSASTLLRRMDMEGIDQSVVLPLGNPENSDQYGVAGNVETLRAGQRHPDRLIPFWNLDPRALLNDPKADFSRLLRVYKDLGCKGIGEVCASLPITDPRYQNLFHHAGAQKMPLLFHFAGRASRNYGVIDKPHFPGLEAALRTFPDTVFIGHGPAFWSEIAWDVKPDERDGYPKGPIAKPGRLWHLLKRYPNLYGDLSAGSGHNALTRDPEAGYRFLETLQTKLFFGTDRFTAPNEPIPPILSYLKEAKRQGKISAEAYGNIMHRNFRRVFR
jgi:predicted TIM-barrel fold metal-dependent hydrolase